MATPEIALRAHRLRREVRAHKASIRSQREQLREKAAALARLEDECRARGIRLIRRER